MTVTATHRVTVQLGPRAYDVVVGRRLLPHLDAHLPIPDAVERVALVTQPPVAVHYAAAVTGALEARGLQVTRLTVPDGERAKDLGVLADLYQRAAALPLRRHDLVVALGGGVVGDLAGFFAATWNRGIPVVQVPTTVLAQVDAAVGGKTGVNLAAGKNLVGAFHQPLAVIADLDTLATLAPRHRVAGLGEVVKYGLIGDPEILDVLAGGAEAAAAGDPDLLTDLVRRSVAIKAAVVAADEREQGRRAHLNLGHTYGHALEAATGYDRFLHGEAVAVGLVVALELGRRLGHTPPELVTRVAGLLDRVGLPVAAPRLERAQVWAHLCRDKKARGGVRFVVVGQPGTVLVVTPEPGQVDAAIDAVERRGGP